MIYRVHEQLGPYEVQDHELVNLQRQLEATWVTISSTSMTVRAFGVSARPIPSTILVATSIAAQTHNMNEKTQLP